MHGTLSKVAKIGATRVCSRDAFMEADKCTWYESLKD